MQELIGLLDGEIETHEARYIAERLMRHPMLGRRNGPAGWISGGRGTGSADGDTKAAANTLANSAGSRASFQHKLGGLPLPSVNPTATVLREEFRDPSCSKWASHQGPLAAQDKNLGTAEPQLEALRHKLQSVFIRNGIPDPGYTLKAIRLKALENERSNPSQPSARWRSDAILDVASSEVVAKVNGWFDEMGTRMTGQFALQARIWTSVMALLVLRDDSTGLAHSVEALSTDDKLRDTLVAQAKDLQKQRDEADEKAKAAAAAAPAAAQEKLDEAARAHAELKQVRETLAQMREPKLSLIPDYLALERVRRAEVSADAAWPATPRWNLELAIGAEKYKISTPQPPAGQSLSRIREANPRFRRPGRPVFARGTAPSLRSSRAPPGSGKIALFSGTNEISKDLGIRFNLDGLWEKKAGLFLSWVLLSLGTPFWYDLMKNLLNLLVAHRQEGRPGPHRPGRCHTRAESRRRERGESRPVLPRAPSDPMRAKPAYLTATGGMG